MALRGKVAMITGSGGEHGFGRAIARRLAADGCDLLLTDVAPTGVRSSSSLRPSPSSSRSPSDGRALRGRRQRA